MVSRDRVEYPVSAGGVVHRVDGGRLQVVVCGRRTPDGWMWGLPKGTPDLGESMEETALREVTEETGLKVTLETPIDSIRYWFVRTSDGVRCHKTVHFYLMSPVGGALEDHDMEFDRVLWLDEQEAASTLTHQNEINILKKAVDMAVHNDLAEGRS